MSSQNIGGYAFLVGIIIAILAGIVYTGDVIFGTAILTGLSSWIAILLVLLGLIIGFLNIKTAKSNDFLIAIIAIASVGLVSLTPMALVVDPLVLLITSIVSNIVVLVAPAALVVGLKQIMILAKDQVV